MPRHQNQANFDPYTSTNNFFTPKTPKLNHVNCDPYAKLKSISIGPKNQVISNATQKPCQFRSLHKKMDACTKAE